MTKIVCTVTTDLNYDQRMIRICSALADAGYEVTLIGRKRKHTKEFSHKPYKQVHLSGWFENGFLFYAEYNISLFFYLLFHKFDIINTCDLDTIFPGVICSKLKGIPVVYDAHEYFTEQEEIVNRPLIKKFWKWIERFSIPKIAAGYTVSKGYAKLFEKEYHQHFSVVRNVTRLHPQNNNSIDTDKYILYQGAVNEGRGLEVLIQSMPYIQNVRLVICGLGDIYEDLILLSKKLGVEDKVEFKGYVEPDQLKKITANAHIGITYFANEGLSHKYSLANRFFDYMHAGVPQIAMAYEEYICFNEEYEVAYLMPHLSVDESVKALNKLLTDEVYYNSLHENALKAREVHNFQQDEKVLTSIYQELLAPDQV